MPCLKNRDALGAKIFTISNYMFNFITSIWFKTNNFGAEILNLGAAILNLFMLLVYFVIYIYFFHFGIYHTVYIINQMCSHKYLNLQLVKGNSNLPVFRWLTRTHGYLASHSAMLCSLSFACLCLWSQ